MFLLVPTLAAQVGTHKSPWAAGRVSLFSLFLLYQRYDWEREQVQSVEFCRWGGAVGTSRNSSPGHGFAESRLMASDVFCGRHRAERNRRDSATNLAPTCAHSPAGASNPVTAPRRQLIAGAIPAPAARRR
jgi:hypothetical protein